MAAEVLLFHTESFLSIPTSISFVRELTKFSSKPTHTVDTNETVYTVDINETVYTVYIVHTTDTTIIVTQHVHHP